MSNLRLSHDTFFKKAFSDIDVAKDFLRNFLPEKVLSILQLKELILTNQSFVSPSLKPYYSDLVYLCKTKEEQPIEVALLFEHKSNVPKYPHIQLLRYQLEFWDSQIKQKKDITPMIPIVVYHGKRKWEQRSFYTYFKAVDPILHAYIPNFEFLLTAINEMQDGEIRALEADWLNNILLLMKYIQDFPQHHFTNIFLSIEPKVEDPAKKNLLMSMIVYFLQNAEISRRQFNELAMTLSGETKKIIMSTYDQLIQEGVIQGIAQGKEYGIAQGIEQGIAQGIEQGIAQGIEQGITQGITQGIEQKNKLVIQKGLDAGLSIELLCELTDLSTEEVESMFGGHPLG